MRIALVGIDLAKKVFHLHATDGSGQEVMRKRVQREDFLRVIHGLPRCRVVMESCGGSNHWCREIKKAGHVVQLISPQHVKPFVQTNKTDYKDAQAICVAASQAHMRYVPQKTIEQQDIQSLHRVRERLVKARTALVNEVRGLFNEYGVILPLGRKSFLRAASAALLAEQDELTSMSRQTFRDLLMEYQELEARIKSYEQRLKTISSAHPVCERLLTVPGVGYLTATAIVASVGDVNVFKNGREFAAWLGLTPREHSTGGKQKLLGISKRGDVYLRKLLIHGARSTIRHLKQQPDRLSVWTKNLLQRKGTNRTAVARANKNARIIWALISHDEAYKTFQLAA